MANSESINLPVPSQERILIALEAAWEAESCAIAALKILEDIDTEHLAARSLVVRLEQLASIGMSALQDEKETVSNLRRELTGVVAEAGHG